MKYYKIEFKHTNVTYCYRVNGNEVTEVYLSDESERVSVTKYITKPKHIDVMLNNTTEIEKGEFLLILSKAIEQL